MGDDWWCRRQTDLNCAGAAAAKKESKVGDNWWEDLSDSGNQGSGNSCTWKQNMCCSNCGGSMDDWWCRRQTDLNCAGAAAVEKESLAFSSVNSFKQGAMLVLALVGLVSLVLFVRQCIFSKPKYDRVADAHAEDI